MIIKNVDNLTDKFDFTIIGSGPASLSLALKLEKKGSEYVYRFAFWFGIQIEG